MVLWLWVWVLLLLLLLLLLFPPPNSKSEWHSALWTLVCVPVSVCLSVCLHLCISVSCAFLWCVCMCVCLCASVCVSVCVLFYVLLSVCVSVRASAGLSVCLSLPALPLLVYIIHPSGFTHTRLVFPLQSSVSRAPAAATRGWNQQDPNRMETRMASAIWERRRRKTAQMKPEIAGND